MATKKKTLTPGLRFNRLAVLCDTGKRDAHRGLIVKCRCDCGKVVEARMKNLRSGDKQSCGCLYKETRADLPKTLITHGLSHTPAAQRWNAMLARCNNPDHPRYFDYGGRGIRVCKRWSLPEGQGLINFVTDMGQPPVGKEIDRRNNDGDYRKSNCRWATRRRQANNKRPNALVTYQGKELTIAQLSRRLGLDYDTTYTKYRSKARIRSEA